MAKTAELAPLAEATSRLDEGICREGQAVLWRRGKPRCVAERGRRRVGPGSGGI